MNPCRQVRLALVLREQSVYHAAVDVGEAEGAALEAL
jgi:hypothetical protein